VKRLTLTTYENLLSVTCQLLANFTDCKLPALLRLECLFWVDGALSPVGLFRAMNKAESRFYEGSRADGLRKCVTQCKRATL